MRIGELADAAGVNVDTVRYYERRGLIADPRGSLTGYRDYPQEAVHVLRFVKRAQALGFTLREIKQLLELRRGAIDVEDRNRVRDLALSRVDDIRVKLRRLTAMRDALETLIASCEQGAGKPECPILDALETDEP